jgi:hypothetical protein
VIPKKVRKEMLQQNKKEKNLELQKLPILKLTKDLIHHNRPILNNKARTIKEKMANLELCLKRIKLPKDAKISKETLEEIKENSKNDDKAASKTEKLQMDDKNHKVKKKRGRKSKNVKS